jgi:hypothetical protein
MPKAPLAPSSTFACTRRSAVQHSPTRSGATGARPGGRVLSRKSPATPSAMKRSCQRIGEVVYPQLMLTLTPANLQPQSRCRDNAPPPQTITTCGPQCLIRSGRQCRKCPCPWEIGDACAAKNGFAVAYATPCGMQYGYIWPYRKTSKRHRPIYEVLYPIHIKVQQ